MSLELQIQSSVLAELAASSVQSQLLAACFPTSPLGFVDHVDVGAAPVEVEPGASTVRLRVPLDVFVVSRAAVLAAPNAVPDGAQGPAQPGTAVLELGIAGAVVSLACVKIEPDVPGLDQKQAVDSFGKPVKVDLGPTLKRLGYPAPATSSVELVDGVVAIRLDPVGPVAAHLFPGQEWGMFFDGPAVEQLALTKVPTKLNDRITSLAVTPHWRPNGTTPHVDLDFAGKAQVPDPFAGDVSGSMACDFALSPPPLVGLRTSVGWSFDVDLGPFAPPEIQLAADLILDAAFDPTTFGGTVTGDHSFTLDSSLPIVSFAGAQLRSEVLAAAPEGMTIGGGVRLPLAQGRATLQASPRPFGLPFRTTFCRELAKSGSGNPSKTVLLSEVSTSGSAWLEDMGAYCGVEVVSPGAWVEQFLTPPATFPEVVVTVPSAVALNITDPVQILVRTARGVRLVDLGVPPRVVLDAEGHVTNAVVSHIPNCLFVNVEHGLSWYLEHPDDPGSLHPPLEHPDWTTFVGSHPGVDVQLVTLTDLQPGELVRFSSADHTVEVTADPAGRALVPVLLPIQTHQPPATLIRVNRGRIRGHVAIESALFVSTPRDLTDAESKLNPQPLPPARDSDDSDQGDLNPQPLPPVDEGLRGWDSVELPGLLGLTSVPGFADAPVALAVLADGSTLVLDRDGQGQVRVAGTFEGPVGAMVVHGEEAFTPLAGRVAVHRVIRV